MTADGAKAGRVAARARCRELTRMYGPAVRYKMRVERHLDRVAAVRRHRAATPKPPAMAGVCGSRRPAAPTCFRLPVWSPLASNPGADRATGRSAPSRRGPRRLHGDPIPAHHAPRRPHRDAAAEGATSRPFFMTLTRSDRSKSRATIYAGRAGTRCTPSMKWAASITQLPSWMWASAPIRPKAFSRGCAARLSEWSGGPGARRVGQRPTLAATAK